MRAFLSALLTVFAIACSPEPFVNGYSASFTAHVKSNCTPTEMDCACVVTKMREQWPSENAAYTAARKQREPRGETDVVNFVIFSLKAQCPSRR